jgi:hypothetical protein
MQAPQGAEIFNGVFDLLNEIMRCQNADATVAAVAMVYVFIDTMAFLAMPAAQTAQTRKDFIIWVDTYLKAEPSERYQYRGLDVYAARCSLLHAFSAEADTHRKDRSVCLFGYTDNGPHAFDPAESTRLAIISVAVLIHDLCKATERFISRWRSDHALRGRVAGRLPALYNTFPIKATPPCS